VAFIVIVTGAGPQSKVITPPAATARTTAAEVQLAAVPVPITRSGRPVFAARAAAGTAAWPSGLPGLGSAAGARVGGAGDGLAAGVAADRAGADATGLGAAGAVGAAAGDGPGAHPASTSVQVRAATAAIWERTARS
jgi:hypothetical protein